MTKRLVCPEHDWECDCEDGDLEAYMRLYEHEVKVHGK